MKGFAPPQLYPITDVRLSGLSHAGQVARLCEGGATFVQLREKLMSPREFYGEAREAVEVARRSGACVVVNDRADVALAVAADGVHLGQDDISPEAARRLLGDGAVIGLSTHNVRQAIEAARMDLDYVAIGPVFGTGTKADAEPVVGLEGVRRVRATLGDKPLVAIGGITRGNARAVLDAGADCVAVIGALLALPGDGDAAEITSRTRQFLAALRS